MFFGPLRDAVGAKEVVVEPDPGTIGGLLAHLEGTYPDLAGRLREDDGLAGDVVVTLNGRHVQHEDGLDTTLSAGDVVRVTTAIYGGR